MAILTEEDPDREIMKLWKDYTTQDATVVTFLKAMKAINPETKNSQWGKLCPDVVHDVTAFTTEPVKETMREYRYGKKKKNVEDEGFQDRDLAEIQELTDNMQQELTAMLPKMT